MLSTIQWKRWAVLAALPVVGVLLLLTAPEPEPVLQQATAPRVETVTVGRHELEPVEVVSGRLDPARKAGLHFELSGQVALRAVEPGQRVDEGDVLLALDDGDYTDALAESGAHLTQEQRNIARDRELLALARSNYRIQKSELERLETLGAESLVSKSHLDEARRQLLQLESEVAQLKAGTGSAGERMALREANRNRAARNLARTQLVAPFAGTVNAVHVQRGDYVTPSQTVVELVDAGSLDLYVEVRGDVAASLAQGQGIDIEVDGTTRHGVIHALQLDPDPETFTHALRIRMPGDGVRPGQVATARLPLGVRHDVVAVPATAILYEEGRTWAFRVNGDTLERIAVTTGHAVDDLRIITRGLAAGERVVVQGVAALSDGQKVTVSDAHIRADGR